MNKAKDRDLTLVRPLIEIGHKSTEVFAHECDCKMPANIIYVHTYFTYCRDCSGGIGSSEYPFHDKIKV